MNIVMLSNFMNHHQLPLCNRLNELCDKFTFICMEKMPEETRQFGYDDLTYLPYVKQYGCDDFNETVLEKAIRSADAVIWGAAPLRYLRFSIQLGKLSFIFSERIWKKGTYRRFIPFIRKKVESVYSPSKNLFVLAASCFLANDLKLIHFPVEKCFKWGYFTEVEKLDITRILQDKPQSIHIVWCGRFIPLKHCEDVIRALAMVKNKGLEFQFDLIGSGERECAYQRLISKNKLHANVHFLGAMPARSVREVMKKSHIFIFSSDFNEGWGAVVNEAMSSGCAPIISHAVGASGFLIQDKINGLLYQSGNVRSLAQKIEFLIEHPEEREKYARNAYATIINEYNGCLAAERLVKFIQCYQANNPLPEFSSGVLSRSPLLKNSWYKG